MLVVGSRCPDCGSLQVLVDGKALATVRTIGRAASRVRLADVRPAGDPRTHDVVLRTSGGRVVLDALGLVP